MLLACPPALALALLFVCCLPAASTPNIVVILADDLGYGDIGAYNPESKIPTPAIDRLASRGMRFTDAHSPSAVCSPTRYALLTGRYAWRTRLKSGVLRDTDPPLIEPGRLTLAAMLAAQGYETAAIGKWHLGHRWTLKDPSAPVTEENIDWTRPDREGPIHKGFTYHFGLGKPSWTFMVGARVLAQPSEPFDWTHVPAFLIGPNNAKGWKAPGFVFERMLPRFAEEAVAFIDRASRAGKPFFLYFTPIAPHRPVNPNDDFRGKSAAGLHGDFVAEFDWAVGEILGAIDRNAAAAATLVIVTSDNGPENDAYRRVLEHDHRSMAELRGVKRDLWEGGHRVPFIARWPGKVPAGRVSAETICLTDLMGTAAEIVGYELPSGAAEDSYSILQALFGEHGGPIREATVHHAANGEFAIRKGEWVLIDAPTGDSNGPRNGEPEWFRRERMATPHDQPGELYHLKEDLAQTKNLYAGMPEKVRELKALLEKYKREGRSVER